MQISHSMVSCYRRCKLRFMWRYVCGYESIAKSPGLAVGSAGHAALAEWYTHRNVYKALEAASAVLTKEGCYDRMEHLRVVLRRYFDWSVSADNFETLDTEMAIRVPLGSHTLYSIVDGVIRATDGTRWVVEHKFNKQASVEHLGLDPQCTIYVAAMEAISRPVSGVLYNVVRMGNGGIAAKQPALRAYAARTEYATELMRYELICQADEIVRFLALPTAEQIRRAYSNPSHDCHWDCDYKLACLSRQYNGDLTILQTQFNRKERERER